MATPEKESIVSEIAEIFEKAKSVFVTDFKGLNVELMIELRQKCREASVNYRVIKNTLAQLAAKKADWNEIVDYFQGPSAIAYSYEDPSAPARVISEFAKKVEKPKIKMALFEGNFYSPENVKEVASLPSKSVLLAQFVGGIHAPIQGVVSGLNGLFQKLIITLDAVRGVKEKT
jgi:large subunit ribosomal protein L10